MTPPLKWAGGKRWLRPKLDALWASSGSERLVEPFAGGLSIALGIGPERALIGDANPHLISFYQHLAEGLDARRVLAGGLDEDICSRWVGQVGPMLEASAKRLTAPQRKALAAAERSEDQAAIETARHGLDERERDVARDMEARRRKALRAIAAHRLGEFENERAYYYAAREAFNALYAEDRHLSPEGAVLFYYLNRTGFNGLCRFSSSRRDPQTGAERRGRFNVPYGDYKAINYRYDFTEYAPTLARWDLVCGDFAQMASGEGDLTYADPPYDVDFTSYSEGGFDWEDQVRLVEHLEGAGGPVVLSNQATERIVDLYREAGYQVFIEHVARSISSDGAGRGRVEEVVAVRGLVVPEGLFPQQA
jgi:DNA adenine methylase